MSCLESVVDEDSGDDDIDIKRMKASDPFFFQKMCWWKYITEVSSLNFLSNMGPSNMGPSISLRSEGKKSSTEECLILTPLTSQ